MKRIMAAALPACLWATVPACSPLSIAVRDQNPWTHLDIKYRQENFHFIIVTDRTGGPRNGVFRDAMEQINLLQPAFVMSVGDLIEGGSDDPAKLNDEWVEFSQMVRSLHMPFFYTPGNHDIYNNLSIDVWQNRFGRSYYHFTYHDVLFIILNTEDPPSDQLGHSNGWIGKAQLAWLNTLLKHGDERWTFLFMHKPLWLAATDQHGEESNWSDVEAVLGDRNRITIFAGHHHAYSKTTRNGRALYRLATTGGGSNLTGPADGLFDHVVWVTMTDTGPIIANLMLDGIWTDDPVVEAERRAR